MQFAGKQPELRQIAQPMTNAASLATRRNVSGLTRIVGSAGVVSLSQALSCRR
jgi:hypothetical protein